ncbi:DUF4178 domain-containing protein [Planctomycetota bacterium]|nr:DUF4178 domain-containing protein [Planctomycetota bacterium]
MAGPEATVEANELRCPNCGAPWTMRGFATTRTLACESCGSVIDTSGERWQVMQKVEGAYTTRPCYALGTRGKLFGTEWEIIGWAKRSVTSWGTRYSWEEHLLYNPYEGFRYLVYQDGHFVWIEPLDGVPNTGVNRAAYAEQSFKHFSTADATVDEVLGEFPWEQRRGDVVSATDYVDPPFILSSEQTGDEMNWSRGQYLERDEVVDAFGKSTRKLGSVRGIHPCQPNPDQKTLIWLLKAAVIAFLLWILLSGIYIARCENSQLALQSGETSVRTARLPAGENSASFPVEITGGRYEGTLEFEGNAPVNNSWVSLDLVLVDTVTETASYVPMEISYYHGTSGGESWSEGSTSESTVIRGVKNGSYLLQVQRYPQSLHKGEVQIQLVRDPWLVRYPCCAFFMILIVPLVVFIKSKSFETRRWAESDHAPSS